MKQFDRFAMEYLPLKDRYSKVDIVEASVDVQPMDVGMLDEDVRNRIQCIADEILAARRNGASVICAFGAHSIKNGLGHLLGSFLEHDWFTHLCTNGAGIIHDWEFAYQGKSSEDVRANVREGHFGTWSETGLYINLAIAIGAYRGLGYGESVGSMIVHDGLDIPPVDQLMAEGCDASLPLEKRAAALDLAKEIRDCHITEGFMTIPHPYKRYCIQSYAFETGKPFTSHPMFGHDIIYTHYANQGASIGRTAERDFLSYADSVSHLEHGVYLSVGSAVMSPMIFEKSLSMSRNVLQRQGKDIKDCHLHIVDLQKSAWDWSKGEPPMDNPAYYLRFMKTFNRMGCPVDYTCLDNKLFFLALYTMLKERG